MFNKVDRSSGLVTGLREDVWQADALASAPAAVLPTGEPLLDAELPGGGWPLGALIEILQASGQHGEWRLLLPALVRQGEGLVVLVGAPHWPFAPALAQQGLAPQRLLWVCVNDGQARLWSAEQALGCADVNAVLLWLAQPVRSSSLRRLHLAAGIHGKLLCAMRSLPAQAESSPAPLRLCLASQPESDALSLRILKRRGPLQSQPLLVPARGGWRRRQLALVGADAGVSVTAVDRAEASACGAIPTPVLGSTAVAVFNSADVGSAADIGSDSGAAGAVPGKSGEAVGVRPDTVLQISARSEPSMPSTVRQLAVAVRSSVAAGEAAIADREVLDALAGVAGRC